MILLKGAPRLHLLTILSQLRFQRSLTAPLGKGAFFSAAAHAAKDSLLFLCPKKLRLFGDPDQEVDPALMSAGDGGLSKPLVPLVIHEAEHRHDNAQRYHQRATVRPAKFRYFYFHSVPPHYQRKRQKYSGYNGEYLIMLLRLMSA